MYVCLFACLLASVYVCVLLCFSFCMCLANFTARSNPGILTDPSGHCLKKKKDRHPRASGASVRIRRERERVPMFSTSGVPDCVKKNKMFPRIIILGCHSAQECICNLGAVRDCVLN